MKGNELIEFVGYVIEENTLPKNVSATLNKILNILNADEDVNVKKNKCCNELEELESNGNNIEAGIRVQILDIASSIEQLDL